MVEGRGTTQKTGSQFHRRNPWIFGDSMNQFPVGVEESGTLVLFLPENSTVKGRTRDGRSRRI